MNIAPIHGYPESKFASKWEQKWLSSPSAIEARKNRTNKIVHPEFIYPREEGKSDE